MSYRVLISPNAFKGTFSPSVAANIIQHVLQVYRPNWKSETHPLADGGDGTLDVLTTALKGRVQSNCVVGPLEKSVKAKWALFYEERSRKKTAVIEMAKASGLALIKGENRIREASTFGTGQLIKAALNKKCTQIYIGVGGTATSDGGAGTLEALGLRYLDRTGKRLRGVPEEMVHLHWIDWSHLDPRLKKIDIYILCDVKNPLLGRRGSARTFGPQKGATPSDVLFLEKVMRRWSQFARVQTKNNPGAGAAGALAFGLSAFLGARLVEGSKFIMKRTEWHKKAKRSQAIITGEGKLDRTSFSGKVIGDIARYRKEAKVYVICGVNSVPRAELKKKGIEMVVEMGRRGLRYPQVALREAVKELLNKIKI